MLTRGLESRDLGVPEWERCFDASRDFELEGVLIGFDDPRRLDDDDSLSIV